MALQGLDHVSVNCADLAKSRAFYAEVLGFRDGARPPFPFPGAWLYLGGRPVVHLVGDAPSRPETGGIDHVAFEAKDIDAVRAHLIARDVAYRESGVPGAPVRQIFLRDPDGVKIELNFRD